MKLSAGSEEVGDAPLLDLLDVLCELSKKFKLDWELMLEDDDQPLGVISHGIAESELLTAIQSITGLSEILGWADSEELYGIDELQGDDGFEDDVSSKESLSHSEPKIIKFRPS